MKYLEKIKIQLEKGNNGINDMVTKLQQQGMPKDHDYDSK